jgi:hypothetical protein
MAASILSVIPGFSHHVRIYSIRRWLKPRGTRLPYRRCPCAVLRLFKGFTLVITVRPRPSWSYRLFVDTKQKLWRNCRLFPQIKWMHETAQQTAWLFIVATDFSSSKQDWLNAFPKYKAKRKIFCGMVKLSLCLSKHHVTTTYGGMEVCFHALTSNNFCTYLYPVTTASVV